MAYLVLLLTLLAGAVHSQWWVALAGGGTLACLSIAEMSHLRPQLAANDNLPLLNPTSVIVAAIHGVMGASAFPLGYAIAAFAP